MVASEVNRPPMDTTSSAPDQCSRAVSSTFGLTDATHFQSSSGHFLPPHPLRGARCTFGNSLIVLSHSALHPGTPDRLNDFLKVLYIKVLSLAWTHAWCHVPPYGIVQNSRSSPTAGVSPSLLSASPCRPPVMCHLYGFAASRMSQGWNHTVCRISRLTFFTQQQAFTICPCLSVA